MPNSSTFRQWDIDKLVMIPESHIQGSEIKQRLIKVAVMFMMLLLIFSLKNQSQFIEKYYSNGLHIFIRRGFQFLFNYIPFSVGDILYSLAIISLIVGFYQLICLLIRKKIRSAGFLLLGFILKMEIAIAAFYLLWALNYFRQSAPERLKLIDYEYSLTQLVTVTSMLIDSANVSRSKLQPSEFNVSNSQILEPAIRAVVGLDSFDPPLIAIKPMTKQSLLSPVLNYLGTAGYYNPFTGEAQFNNLMPIFTQPFVACHEMAHQMGFGAEDEANFAAFIAGKSSQDELLKYSSYYLAAQEFMNEVWRIDSTSFKQMKAKISPNVIQDLQTEREYWTKYQGAAAGLSSVFYDNYLKANKQPEGLKTYNRMIKLSMAYYRKKGIIFSAPIPSDTLASKTSLHPYHF